jgi:hypothetical protein
MIFLAHSVMFGLCTVNRNPPLAFHSFKIQDKHSVLKLLLYRSNQLTDVPKLRSGAGHVHAPPVFNMGITTLKMRLVRAARSNPGRRR